MSTNPGPGLADTGSMGTGILITGFALFTVVGLQGIGLALARSRTGRTARNPRD